MSIKIAIKTTCSYCMDKDVLCKPFDDRHYCEKCEPHRTGACFNCSEVHSTRRLKAIASKRYCFSCVSTLFYSCYNCGTNVSVSQRPLFLYIERPHCKECYEDITTPRILSHDDKPDCIYHKLPSETLTSLFIGIELEVEGRGDWNGLRRDAAKVQELTNKLVYCKSDGSISNGYEIVSHPMTEAWLKKNKELYKQSFKFLMDNNYKSYDTSTCGIHIHMSKSSFTTFHLFRFMKFFYENKSFILFISQRKADKFNQWAKLDDHKRDSLMRLAKSKYNSGDRYQAINLTEHTIEVRIFRGTLNENSFFKNTEFLFSLFKFTKSHNADKIKLSTYLDYIAANKKEYKCLFLWLQSKAKTLCDLTSYKIEDYERCVREEEDRKLASQAEKEKKTSQSVKLASVEDESCDEDNCGDSSCSVCNPPVELDF